MLPFGQTVWLWRVSRGWTQERLARTARIPRPNLSAIERGKREVSLSTLRALAVALGVRPGALVDGEPPVLPRAQAEFSRERLERIADAVVTRRTLADAWEQSLVTLSRILVRHRMVAVMKRRGSFRRGQRAVTAAWLHLQAACPPPALASLLQRIEDRQRAHESEAN